MWAEEAERRLRHVIADIETDRCEPLRRVGFRLLSGYPLKPALKETIGRICGQSTDPDSYRLGLRRRTLERICGRLAGCTLSAAAVAQTGTPPPVYPEAGGAAEACRAERPRTVSRISR